MLNPLRYLIWLTIVCMQVFPAAAVARERLLMDANWRFILDDPSDAIPKDFAYPEVKDLAKANVDDVEQEAKLSAMRSDPIATHLGETLSTVQPAFDDTQWRQLDLPHDWVVELPFDKGASESHGFHDIRANRNNIGWYRKSFDLTAEDKGQALSIEFDGVYRNCVVWLNGHCLGRNVSGYSSFAYDITKAANCDGKNELVVRVDASRNEGWFYEGAGIYRHVWLVKTNPTHIAETYITSTVDDKGKATVAVHCTVDHPASSLQESTVKFTVVDSDGKAVANATQTGANVFDQQLIISHPQLWSCDSPSLYTLFATVTHGAGTVDSVQTRFAIRTIKFDVDQGFFLNGQHVLIKGTCNHQDHAGVGVALPDALQYFRLKKLKEMGFNAIRTSHNPATPELLDAADKLGMLVMEEQRESGETPEILGQTRRMILRDRNHPSIILWSIGNEEGRIQGRDDVGVSVARAMSAAIREIDPSRLITAAMNGQWGKGFSRVVDVEGFNYPLNTDVTKYHQKHARQPLIASEEASTVSTRGIYENDKTRGYVAAYDLNTPSWACTAEKWWNYYQSRPFMAGAFVWTGFDYRGEPTPYGWPCINSHFGIFDTCGFPKDNFYYYQSIWTEKPMLHLLPHWNWAGKEGQLIDVWAYSNCDEVELSVNGRSQGRQSFPAGKHLQWKIPYAPGVLLAHGFKAGHEVVTEKIETTGPAARLVVTSDRQAINADGEDVAVVTVAVTDDHGQTVPTAANLVKFTIEGTAGKILGVGNGDPSCHEPDKADQRSAFNGLCMAIVQSTTTPDSFKITVTADGLQPATQIITTVPAAIRKKI